MLKDKRIVFLLIIIAIFTVTIASNLVPEFFYRKGIQAFNQGNYVAASKDLGYALTLSPSNSDYRYYFVQTLTKFKPSVRIQEEMFKFMEDDMKDSAHISAGIQVAVWRNNINQMYGNNYIEQAPLDKDIIRWNPKTFPLKVYINLADISSVPDYYNTEIIRAFGQWQASSGFITFKFMNSPDAADIVVNFAPLPTSSCKENGCKYVVAHTIPTIKNNILKKMTITVYDRDANGSYFSDKELYNTILHEVGHSLGIMGHSYSTDDLMYMSKEVNKNSIFLKYRSDFQYISIQDISTLKLLYNLVPTITNTPLDEISTDNLIYPPIILGSSKQISTQKLKEAQQYVKEAPNLPNGYIDMAVAYDELGKFDKALEALQNAFNNAKTDSDKYIVLYNYAAMYLNNDKPETALEYAKQAQQIINSEEIADLMSNIEHAISTKSAPFKRIKLLK